MNNLVDKFSIGFAIVASLVFVFYKIRYGKDIKLEDTIIVAIASSILPTAFTIILYPFIPCLIKSIEDIRLHISIMGLVLLFVYVKVIIKRLSS